MPKRTFIGDGVPMKDAPDIIATRPKAKISSRFRKNKTQAAPASSAFGGTTTDTPKSGFVFEPTIRASEAASNPFSLGSAAISPSAYSTSSMFGSTAPGISGAQTLDVESSTAATGFSFLGNFPADTLTPISKPPDAQVPPVAAPAKPHSVGQVASRGHGSTPNGALVSANTSGLPFGEGMTAAQGARLNKLFASWISHQMATNPASTLDVGLRDYVAFAAEIRDRAEFSRADTVSTAGVAFKHPSASAVTASSATSSKLQEAPTAVSQASIPPPAAIPAPAPTKYLGPAKYPEPAVTSTPAFSFSTPSALPPPPSGARFLFERVECAEFNNAPSAPAPTAPFTASTGFTFDTGSVGGVNSTSTAPKDLFNGFKMPAGVAIAPAAVAGAAGGAEDDGMPKEDPTKLERAPGEEDEEIIHQFRAKLYRFKKDESSWGDMGVGLLRLMKHTANNARRLVLRNDMGKVLLNTAMYKGMKVTKTKKSITFLANIAGDGLTSVMIKVAANELQDLFDGVLALVPSS